MKRAMRKTPTPSAREKASSPSKRKGGTGTTIMSTTETIPMGTISSLGFDAVLG
jgi:hypothetical protein